MFNFWRKKPRAGTAISFRISSMHCASCAMSIDDALEEIPGVITSQTSYARGITVVEIEAERVKLPDLKEAIASLGYQAEQVR